MADQEIRILQLTPEIRQGEGGKRTIAGYAVKWEQLSLPIWGLWKEKFARGAFAGSLIQRSGEIFATWQHNMAEVLGRSPNTLTVREDETGLFYEIDPPSWAERHVETIERGDVRGSSFTFVAQVEEWDYSSDPDYVIRTVRSADLYEVAPVTMPAFPQTTAGVRGGMDAASEQIAKMIRQEKHRRSAEYQKFLERQKALRDISIQAW